MDAQGDQTAARVCITEQRYKEAERLALASLSVLEAGGQQSLFADTLQTLGIAQARQGRYPEAFETLKRAAALSDAAGDAESSGTAFLTMIEELSGFLPPNEIAVLYAQVDRRFGENTSSGSLNRLRACARLLVPRPQSTQMAATETGHIPFEHEVLKCESVLIKRALTQANGSVTRAAKILGLTHQGLCYIINHRHKELLKSRAPIRVRRKSVMKRP